MTQHRSTPPWDFDYAPIAVGGGDDGRPENDLVLATADDVDPAFVAHLLAASVPNVAVTPLFNAHPIFWTRIESSQPIDRDALARRLGDNGASVRYVASSRRGSHRLPPKLDCVGARLRRAAEWAARVPSAGSEPESPWRWFLRSTGVDVNRAACGSGAGSRLAIIDNDGRDLDSINLDAEVLVDVASVPRAASHAALLLGWAVGARRSDRSWFRGVAPDASPRFYCVPKAGDEVVSLPLAIVRAVEDGACVIVCATYVEGLTSPLLDDALEFSSRLGRGGRGTAVILPTGREMSSPESSVHSSLSLGMMDPAADPRVFCVGPSSRDGGWFLWRDRRGKLRPFANRGPSIRWLAPGDDMADPFALDDRPRHAESSGASAIAAGVTLLALSTNSQLELRELETLLSETAASVDATRQASEVALGDYRDVMPCGVDSDGHNAKHGYGRLNATAACLGARDPVAFVLVRMGEAEAGLSYVQAIAGGRLQALYGAALAGWAARTVLGDARLTHALTAVARAVRLGCRHPERSRSQPPGHLLRHLGIIVRMLLDADPGLVEANELRSLERLLQGLLQSGAQEAEAKLIATLAPVLGWKADSPGASHARLVSPRMAPERATAGVTERRLPTSSIGRSS